VSGLQGGRNPARAFAQFMKVAVANRPVENFDTDVTLPEWQLEPDDEAYMQPDQQRQVDEDGNPLPDRATDPLPADENGEPVPATAPADPEATQRIDQKWIDGVLGRR